MNYFIHIVIFINIYLILAMALNLLAGYGGLISMAMAAFYGIGAYATTLLMMETGLSFWLALPAAVLISALFGWLLALTSIRLKGDYFILTTLGFQVICYGIFYNCTSLTRGPFGIPGIPRPSLFGQPVATNAQFLFLTIIVLLPLLFLVKRLYDSPFGRTLKAIREDETAAIVLAKDTVKFKTQAFIISSGLAAIAGGLYAVYVSYIDPSSFTLGESIFILSLVIIGGSGNFRGPVIGVIVMIILPELLRFAHIPDAVAANLRQVIYGLILIILMRLRPQGLAGEYGLE